MAVEGITGGAYQDSTAYPNRVRTDLAVPQAVAQPQIRITEVAVTERGNVDQQLNHNPGGSEQQSNVGSDKQLQEALSKANKSLKAQFTRAEFTYHKDTKRVSIKVIDEATDEVLREIPSEKTMEALEMLTKMVNMAGFFVDEKK